VLGWRFELTITHAEDDELRDRCKAIAAKLGRDPQAMWFGASGRS
jgi:hypothetical protein